MQRFQTINHLNQTKFLLSNPKNPESRQIQAQRGGNKVLTSPLFHPKPQEEDSLGVLTVPYDLCKEKMRKAEQKN